MKNKRIIITGGHHNSALVVAEELRRRGHEIVWFGHKYTMPGDKKPGAEYREVAKAGFKFIEIRAVKFHRVFNLASFFLLPLNFLQVFYYLIRFRPALIFSFGGYLAAPVVVYGWFLGIPSITHEQTVVYGLANRVIGRFAKKIMVSWEASLKHFSPQKVVFTGLPLRKQVFTRTKGQFDFKNKLPTIYLTGGKQGSQVLNQALEKALTRLLKKHNIIHQCGSTSLTGDYQRFQKIGAQLPPRLKQRYQVSDYYPRSVIGRIFAAADLVVGRSGAHITYELAALGKPALLIPIPWSSANEQVKNAQLLAEAGTAEILPQKELNEVSLPEAIEKMISCLPSYQKNASKAKKLVKLDAAEKVTELVEEVVS